MRSSATSAIEYGLYLHSGDIYLHESCEHLVDPVADEGGYRPACGIDSSYFLGGWKYDHAQRTASADTGDARHCLVGW